MTYRAGKTERWYMAVITRPSGEVRWGARMKGERGFASLKELAHNYSKQGRGTVEIYTAPNGRPDVKVY